MNQIAILGIQTPGHELFRKVLGNIDFDRIAIMTVEKAYIYWTIPSSKEPWIGDVEDMPVSGSTIFSYVINIQLKVDIFENIPYEKTSILTQYKNYTPDGVKFINSILEKIINPKYLNKHNINMTILSLLTSKKNKLEKLFSKKSPDVYEQKDLLDLILYNPDIPMSILTDNYTKSIKTLLNTCVFLFEKLCNTKKITKNEILDHMNIVNAIYIQFLNTYMKSLDIPQSDTNILFEIDKSLEINIEKLKYNIGKILNPSLKTPIYVYAFLETINNILVSLNTAPLNITLQKNYSAPLLLYDDTHNKIKFIKDDSLKSIEIPLNGEGLESYSKEELYFILEAMDIIDCTDNRFDEIRSIISIYIRDK